MPDGDNEELVIKPDDEKIGEFSYKPPLKEVKPPQMPPPPPPPAPNQPSPPKPSETKKEE